MNTITEINNWFANPVQFRENITSFFAHDIIPIAVERLNKQFSPKAHWLARTQGCFHRFKTFFHQIRCLML
jgi:hypothetical protein